MGKPPPSSTSVSSNPTPSSFTPSDASLSAFLARDPDILSLNGLTLSPGGSVAPSATTAMDDDEHNDFTYKHSSVPPYADLRSSYATTAATNEGSNHSQFNYANMTPRRCKPLSVYFARRIPEETHASMVSLRSMVDATSRNTSTTTTKVR